MVILLMATDNNSPKKILVVEDNENIRSLYEMKLQFSGFDVAVAKDGKDGLKKAKKLKPDLILLDLLMPEMNGDRMLEKLRAEDWGEHVKVVVLTNVSRAEATINLRNLGVHSYLVKANYTPSQVLNVVEEALKE